MPTHSEKRVMPHSAAQMYQLIADIEAYEEFLPWVAAARITRRQVEADHEIVDADLVVSFKVFREKFGSRVTLRPAAHEIDVAYLDGPFKYLNNHWKFTPIDDASCEVDFFVDFEFRSFILQKMIGVVFTEAMERIVRAFEARAKDLYG